MPAATTYSGKKVWQWDEESRQALMELREEGYSASLAAEALTEQLGVRISRNAVIGVLHRMGVKAGKRRPTIRKPAPRQRHMPRMWHAPNQPIHRPWGGEQIRTPYTTGIPFGERQGNQCAYPVEGAGIDMKCCGAQCYEYGGTPQLKRTRFPYCWYHCNAAYRWRRDCSAPAMNPA